MARRQYSQDPGDTTDVDVLLLTLSAEQWTDLRGRLSDPTGLENSYAAWTAAQARRRAKALTKGYRVLDRPLDIGAAMAWCLQEQRSLSYGSICTYLIASVLASRRPKRP